MTQANLLARMMTLSSVTMKDLREWFGYEFLEPLNNLRALGIVVMHPDDNQLYVSGWNGERFVGY